jgi:YidC/Oxa1 family membrane protein insertase
VPGDHRLHHHHQDDHPALTVQSIRSSKAMQELQPKIKELQKKHGKDRQRLSTGRWRSTSSTASTRWPAAADAAPIPIFLALQRHPRPLQPGERGLEQRLPWCPDLSQPDPITSCRSWRRLPVRPDEDDAPGQPGQDQRPPAGDDELGDERHALTVILFGWSFAAGPVIYWATQSVYSVVQQWFITGWGSLRDWLPNLPELPEHRRLGYRAPVNPEDLVVVGGEGGQVVRAGVGGWFQKKMEEAQQQALARSAQTGSAEATPEPEPDPTPVVVPAARNGKRAGGPNGRARANGAAGQANANANAKAHAQSGAAATAAPSKAVIVPRKAKASVEPPAG